MQKVTGAARDHRTRLRIGERQRVQTFAAQQRKQCMPRGMKLQRVDPLAARTMRDQFG